MTDEEISRLAKAIVKEMTLATETRHDAEYLASIPKEEYDRLINKRFKETKRRKS